MFEQFRSHFPRGSLISELVQIDHGKYIVRASVQNEGLTLATGLAAADTVEKAEDQARMRALAVLDIALTPVEQPQPPVSVPASAPRKTATKSPRPKKTSSEAVTHTSSNNVATVDSEESATSPQKTAIAPPLHPPTSGGSEGGSPSPPKTEKQSSTSDEQETVMDSSDIIARTNVELRRLNWTSEQGRKFLQETYGKRSRSLLSDSELLEFLEYLEKQPTPSSE